MWILDAVLDLQCNVFHWELLFQEAESWEGAQEPCRCSQGSCSALLSPRHSTNLEPVWYLTQCLLTGHIFLF